MQKTILVVDDSPSFRQLLVLTLETYGYQVLIAKDGEAGLKIAQKQTVDLVLMDHNMPNMDGLTLIKHLRAFDNYVVVPILMLTSEASAEMKMEARAAGANGILVKPFDPKKLLAVLQKVITQAAIT